MQEIASEFSGKKIFSTLDLKDGYWQIQLDEKSSLLCTFNTPFGRYRFTRMPFGIRSASEVFQKQNEAAFTGIPGLYIVADDLIIAADSIEQHEKIWEFFMIKNVNPQWKMSHWKTGYKYNLNIIYSKQIKQPVSYYIVSIYTHVYWIITLQFHIIKCDVDVSNV